MYKNVAHMGQACVVAIAVVLVVAVIVAVIDRHAVEVDAYVSHVWPLLSKAHFYIVSTKSEHILHILFTIDLTSA